MIRPALAALALLLVVGCASTPPPESAPCKAKHWCTVADGEAWCEVRHCDGTVTVEVLRRKGDG